jgi:methionyl-tRNA formyltransferase
MRLIFMGTAGFACPTLRQLQASSHQIAAVVTQPDRPRGRGQQLAQSPVKTLALVHGLPVLQPATLRSQAVLDELAGWHPDVIVVVAYGNILPAAVLALPPYGCLNLHASLLPKYRGPAPINWALIQGETCTGYTIIQMDAHVDTGPMLWSEACPITADDDAISVAERLAEAGALGMLNVLTGLAQGTLTPQPQPEEGASRAPKLTRELGQIDWRQSATTLHNRIRGLVPWPGASAMYHGLEVKIWRAAVLDESSSLPPGTVTALTPEGFCLACGSQQLVLLELQPANRRRMSARDFVQGYRLQQGDRFA